MIIINDNRQLTKIITYIVFLILFFTGLFVSQCVGTYIDEGLERRTGIIALNEYVRVFFPSIAEEIESETHIPRIFNHQDKYYGVVLQYPMLVFEKLLRITDGDRVWKFRHAYSFLIFFISLILFYHFLLNVKFSSVVSLTTIFFVFLSPRVLYESAYNIKDIGLLSTIFCIFYTGERFYQSGRMVDALFFAIATALACGVRLIAGSVSFIFVTAFVIKRIQKKDANSKHLFKIMVYLFISFLLLYSMYPGSWFDPFFFFPKAFAYMSKHPWSGDVLFLGKITSSSALPWNYLLIWMLITLPEFLLILAIIGMIKCLNKTSNNELKLLNIGFLVYIIFMMVAFIIARPNVYDGWRHFYYLFSFIVYFSAYGIIFIVENVKKNRFRYSILIVVLCASVVTTFQKEIVLFPYGNVYFNIFAGANPDKKFESDYWGLSYLDAWKWLGVQNSEERVLYVSGNGPIDQSIEMFSIKFQKTFSIIKSENTKDFDYYILVMRAGSKSPVNGEPVFSVTREGMPLLKIYKGEKNE